MMKGMLQSLEAVIGILLILSVLVLVYSRDVQLPELDTINLKLRGFYALQTLDRTGELRKSILLNDTIDIENKISDFIPKNLNNEIIFCELTCAIPNIASDRIITVNYLIAGDVNNINPKQTVLYMWYP